MTGVVSSLSSYGPWVLGGTVALLAIFFLLRRRIRVEKGWAGFNIARFSVLERLAHWLLAIAFIVLAVTGLAIQYGSAVLVPLLGPRSFAEVLRVSKALHGVAAIAFMPGLLLGFVLWTRHSLPHWRDAIWLLKGGGMIVRGWHAPAWRFNAGQKVLFWLVMAGGVLLSVSGTVLLFPSQAGLFAKMLILLDAAGLQLPTELTPAEERQYAAAWHSAVALGLICVVVVHIYIRSVGIQGAFSAMHTGQVDANWAEQHHSLWAARELKRMDEAATPSAGGGTRVAPAE
jgi:formate dehydrogenase subunit gamma